MNIPPPALRDPPKGDQFIMLVQGLLKKYFVTFVIPSTLFKQPQGANGK